MIKIIALLSALSITFYGAILLIALSSRKFRNRFYLGLFFSCSFLIFFGHFLSFFEFWKIFRYFDALFLAMLLAFYPFFYLYILKTFSFQKYSFRGLYHFIPSILVFIGMLTVILSSDWKSYEIYMNNNLYGHEINDQTSKILAIFYKGSRFFHLVQIVLYNFIIVRLMLHSKKRMNDLYSNLDKYQLRYFYIINISFLICMSIPGFFVTIIGRAPLNTDGVLLLVICLLFSTLYVILLIIGLRQILPEIERDQEHIMGSNAHASTHEISKIENELLDYFSSEKPWLKSNLNIWEVARNLGTNRTYISQIINENMGGNFNHFVNQYRINEAKILLRKSPSLYMTEISDLSGFGSVNSFLRIFKLLEQCTPTEYKKKYY